MDLNQFEIQFKLTTETMEYYCTIGFYSFLAFQRHIICYFLIYSLKDMNFVSFQIFEFYSNQTKPGLDTWLNLIGRYRFGWIRLLDRWIL
jgi:hypothetical protein